MNRMVQRQQHRGPDDRGLHSDGPATLGMCRLAIIDPANGHQPMTSPDGRFTGVDIPGALRDSHAAIDVLKQIALPDEPPSS